MSHLARGPDASLGDALCVSTGASLQKEPSADPSSPAQKAQQVGRIDHAKAEIALCWSQGPFKVGVLHLGDFSSTGLVGNLSYLNSLGVQPQIHGTQRN